MANYSRLDTLVRAVVLGGRKKIAICPFAEEGMMTKQILNQRYGIQETYLVDNRLADINPAVIKVEDLKKNDTERLVILLVIDNREINLQLENQIKQLGLDVEIQNSRRPAMMHVPEKEDYFRQLKSLLKIRKPQNVNLIRLGKDYDGGYILADKFKNDMTCYSFGIAGDVSFDRQVAEYGIQVHMYDHTIAGLPEEHLNFCFHKCGISAIDEIQNHKLSMKTILAENGDSENHKLILKMDVEGAEWDFLQNVPSKVLDQFEQITFELHRLTDMANAECILGALAKLNKSHQPVWIHANNFGHIEEANGLEIPAYVEVTYLNRECFSFSEESCTFPLDIDQPDCASIEEYNMGNW